MTLHKNLTRLTCLAAVLLLAACAPPHYQVRENYRKNDIYQTGQTGDIWECKDGDCYQIK